MRFLRQQVIPNTDWAAGSFGPRDLPVNPLTMLLLSLELTNANPTAIGTYSGIDDILDNVTSLIVKHKGENIVQGSLRDIAVMNAVKFGQFPGWDRLSDANGGIRRVTFPICFGRKPFDPKECFPATTRGNLTFEATRAANAASFSDVNIVLESVELIEADPERFCKYTTQSMTPGATGLFDLPLPIGNPLLALLLFDTAIATLTTATSSWGQTKLLKDNVEQYYALTDFQTLAGEVNRIAQQFVESYPGHIHQINDGAALSNSDDAKTPVSTGVRGYGVMDFDPLGDGSYMLETEGAADLKLRGSATSATAVRCLPLELVSVK